MDLTLRCSKELSHVWRSQTVIQFTAASKEDIYDILQTMLLKIFILKFVWLFYSFRHMITLSSKQRELLRLEKCRPSASCILDRHQ